MLLLLNVSQEYVKAGVLNSSNYQILGAILLKARELISLSTIFVFGFGALMFYVLVFQSQLIPRWLSIWDIVAIALRITYSYWCVNHVWLANRKVRIKLRYELPNLFTRNGYGSLVDCKRI